MFQTKKFLLLEIVFVFLYKKYFCWVSYFKISFFDDNANQMSCLTRDQMWKCDKSNYSLKNGIFVFLGLRPLGPIAFIVTVSRNRLVWPEWSTKIIHKNAFIVKNTANINRRIFQVLFVQGIFSKPFVNFGVTIVGSINTTNIKVCVFRGLSRDHIKLWNWDIIRACVIEKLH